MRVQRFAVVRLQNGVGIGRSLREFRKGAQGSRVSVRMGRESQT